MKQKMLQEISELPSIPETSARAFHEHMSFLLDRVNKELASREDLSSLIGQNLPVAMFDNHRNHAVFMDNVFQLSLFSLLIDIVPWVYRAYSSHGFSLDYFPVHLKAWKEALRENLDPETSAPLLRVYEWMLSHHQDFAALSREASSGNGSPRFPESEEQNRFLQALLQGDRRDALQISREQVDTPRDLQRFYEGILKPVMYRVGDLWEQGDISVAKEHLASALANMAVSSQYIRVMTEIKPWKGRVLVSAASNEFHVLGAQMIANCLEAEGWEVDYLGADTPVPDLVGYIKDKAPDVVALSVTMPFNLIKAKDIIERIVEESQQARPWILLGGLAFAGHPELVSRMGADGYAENCSRAIEHVEKWREARDG